MHLDDPTFPPLLTGHAVKAPLAAFDAACRRAAAGQIGAGDLVWSRNTARAECALVLEPEVSLGRACQMAPLAMVAVAETLGHLCPPQVAVEFRWPGTILVNGGDCGQVRLACAASIGDVPPAWLVAAVTMQLASRDRRREPGESRDLTSLVEEGAGDVTRTDFVAALAVRLMAWLHTWGEDGYRPIHDQWLFRAEGRASDTSIGGTPGRVLGLDEDANLMLRSATSGKVETLAFLPHAAIMATAQVP